MINLVASTLFFHLYEFLVLAMDVQTTNIWLSTNIGLVTVEQSGNTKIMAHYCTCIKSQPLILSHFPFIKQRRIASLYQNEPLRNNKFWGLNWIPNCIFERIPIPNSGSIWSSRHVDKRWKRNTKKHANLQGTIVNYLYHRKTVNPNFKLCNFVNNSLQKGSHFVIVSNHSYLQDSTNNGW